MIRVSFGPGSSAAWSVPGKIHGGSRFCSRGAVDDTTWEVLCRPGRGSACRRSHHFAGGQVQGVFGERRGHGLRLLHLNSTVLDFLECHGHVPLPPYIKRDDVSADIDEYQTVYAERFGGDCRAHCRFHFTGEMLEAVRTKGVEVVKITLHVGIGTFFPFGRKILPSTCSNRNDFTSPERRRRASTRRRTKDGASSPSARRRHGRWNMLSGTMAVSWSFRRNRPLYIAWLRIQGR